MLIYKLLRPIVIPEINTVVPFGKNSVLGEGIIITRSMISFFVDEDLVIELTKRMVEDEENLHIPHNNIFTFLN